MLTGFTTSVEYKGVTYHVQTEDKGLGTPVILSLVYDGGTVLATKRTSYEDLVTAGFDADTLSKRLKQQHKLICAAILSGRLEDLKRLSVRETGKLPKRGKASEKSVSGKTTRHSKKISLRIERGVRFKSGEHKHLQVIVSSALGEAPLKDAQVTAKIIGTRFRPLILHARTDADGLAEFRLSIPEFGGGRGALILTAVHGEDEAELRRVVRPS